MIERYTGNYIFDRIATKSRDYVKENSIKLTNYLNQFLSQFKILREWGFNIETLKRLWQAYSSGDLTSILANPSAVLMVVAKKFIKLTISKPQFELHPYHPDGTQPIKPIFGLQYPAFNYLGPGTEVYERAFVRGQEGINFLDKGAKLHDIVYYETDGAYKDGEITKEKQTEMRKEADLLLKNYSLRSLLHSEHFIDYVYSIITYIAMTFKIDNNVY
jgi:hypothetical protein